MAERSDGCSGETMLAPCTREKRLQIKMTKDLTLLPTGGGFLSHTTIVLAATLKPLKLWLPKFVTSCFYLFATI